MNPFEVNRKTRANILGLLDGMSIEQLNKIPKGHSNNLIWHFGHVLATQQLLTYGLSGTEIILSDTVIDEFRKGTKPEQSYSEDDMVELRDVFMEVIDRTEDDYTMEMLTSEEFKEYPTSYGITLESVEDALAFNNIHEGLHLGIMMAIKKLV